MEEKTKYIEQLECLLAHTYDILDEINKRIRFTYRICVRKVNLIKN